MTKILGLLLASICLFGCQPRDPRTAQEVALKTAQELQAESDAIETRSLCIRAMSGDIYAYVQLQAARKQCPIP